VASRVVDERHLARGLERIVEWLWALELSGSL
jgi:hypothetical protein